MNIVRCEQGTREWFAARAGSVTASMMPAVMARIKTGEAATRRDYRVRLITELLTGEPETDDLDTAAIRWGKEQEPFARAAYEMERGVFVDQVGFVLHPTIERAGCSPDGLAGEDGLIEIKCPKTSTHIEYLMDGVPPAKYRKQMLWQMACTERQWCDFVSYDPRLPENLQLFVVRFDRDDDQIRDMEHEVINFNAEVDAVVAALRSK